LTSLADALGVTVASFADSTPSVSLAYVENGAVVTASWGADTDTLFQAASISKPVAAFLALSLVAEGKLSLDDRITARLRSWKGTLNPQITLRQLLCHGAGLGVHGFPGYRRGERLPTLIEILDGLPPANTPAVRSEGMPGVAAVYSGGGYTVLQLLIEDLTERSFADLAAERIFAPLRMTSAIFEQPLAPQLEPRVAPAHSGGRPIEGGWHVYPELAAAGLWCTPIDLLRFAGGVQAAFEGESGAVVPQWLVKEMLRPHFPGWGLGVALYGTPQSPHFGHTGGNSGYRCELFASARRGPAAVVMTNSDEGGDVVPALLNQLAPHLGWTVLDRQELMI
jgi:CubicO group peptidase (beta-lactamase class C family)